MPETESIVIKGPLLALIAGYGEESYCIGFEGEI